MLVDWVVREGSIVLSWWLVTTAIGITTVPLCIRLFRSLPDYGITLARVIGLGLVCYIYWLLATLGFLQNTLGNILFSITISTLISIIGYFTGSRSQLIDDLKHYWRHHKLQFVLSELIFLILFIGWAIVRAHQNELRSTEKPMDLMFISSIMRSNNFPPNDAWLSGYSISYYYFGYIIAAVLSMLTNVSSPTGFNLYVSLVFALVGSGVFGATYNLIRKSTQDLSTETATQRNSVIVGCSILAVICTLIIGNFQFPLVEIPYETGLASDSYLSFWNTPERLTPNNMPQRDISTWDTWWWFRASRIINDIGLDGVAIGAQPITEFPQFSFLLADSHPHVMSLPFAIVAISIAMSVIFSSGKLDNIVITFFCLFVGLLIFLNTWDAPIYFGLVVVCDFLRRGWGNGRLTLTASDAFELTSFVFKLVLGSVILYLPFLLTFRSQAAGIEFNSIYITTMPQYFLIFGPFIILLGIFLIVEAIYYRNIINMKLSAKILSIFFFSLIALSTLFTMFKWVFDNEMSHTVSPDSINRTILILAELLGRRVSGIPTLLLILGGLSIVIGLLLSKRHENEYKKISLYWRTKYFLYVLISWALLLTLLPEFIFLRDVFATRMNTVFKFYYQAWLMFAITSSVGFYFVLANREIRKRTVFIMTLAVCLVVLLGGLYPVFAIHVRSYIETGRAVSNVTLTLDSGRGFTNNVDDYAAIQCLSDYVGRDEAVVVEAVGNSYDPGYGRVAALTGIPIVMGWAGHESQWRGNTYSEAAGNRVADIATLYNALTWHETEPILRLYNIDFIFYGHTERNIYDRAGELKFRDNLEIVCQRGNSYFYSTQHLTS